MSLTDLTFMTELVHILANIPGMEKHEIRGSLLRLYFTPFERSTIDQARKTDDMYTDLQTIVKIAADLGGLDRVIDNAVGRPQDPENKIELNKIKQKYLDYRKEKERAVDESSRSTQRALAEDMEGDYGQSVHSVSEHNEPLMETRRHPHSSSKFDVFLIHNSQDKPQVEAIAEKLRQRGINPWLDKEQIRPGQWFQDIIQQMIPTVKAAAIFIGPKGLGKWQAIEVRVVISRADAGFSIIPVLLPGVNDIPENFLFLKELNWVRFNDDIHDAKALDQLEWGIRGKHLHSNS